MKRHLKTYTIIPEKKEVFLQAIDEYLSNVKKDTRIIECYIHPGAKPHSFTHFISFIDKAAEEEHAQESYVKNFEESISPFFETEAQHIKLAEEGYATGIRPTHAKEEVKEQEAISLYKKQEDIDNIK